MFVHWRNTVFTVDLVQEIPDVGFVADPLGHIFVQAYLQLYYNMID